MMAALPPLNQALARYQIIGALKSRKIREQASPERLDIDALGQVLCQLSELLLAFPRSSSWICTHCRPAVPKWWYWMPA